MLTSRSRSELKRIYVSLGQRQTLLLYLEFPGCYFNPLKCKLKFNEDYIDESDITCVNIDCNGMFRIVTKRQHLHLLKNATLDFKKSLLNEKFCLF